MKKNNWKWILTRLNRAIYSANMQSCTKMNMACLKVQVQDQGGRRVNQERRELNQKQRELNQTQRELNQKLNQKQRELNQELNLNQELRELNPNLNLNKYKFVFLHCNNIIFSYIY